MLLDILEQKISNALSRPVTLIKPKDPSLGDCTIVDKDGKSVDFDTLQKLPFIKSLERVGIFINLKIEDLFLWELLTQTKTIKSNEQKIMFEYGCANTHKNPHIGHLYSYIFGDAMSSILSTTGNLVIKSNYQGDVGLHVAKCLWGTRKTTMPSEETDTVSKMRFLQDSYQAGAIAYEDDESAKNEIDEINRKIYAKNDEAINELYKKTRLWSIDFYQFFEKELGIKQSVHVFESELVSSAKSLVEQNLEKVFSKSEGAIVFDKEHGAPHTRVFVNNAGNVTYEAKDLALASFKLDSHPECDRYILTTASEQSPYFQVIITAIEKVFPSAKGKFVHIPFGFVSLGEGKISSRKGALSGYELLQKILEQVRSSNPSLDESSNKKIALSALKFGFLKQTRTQNIVFEPEKALQLQGATGPYLLYTYVRCASILQKAPTIKESFELPTLSDSEHQLVVKLLEFDEVIANSAKNFTPHLLANYLLALAQQFSNFYAQTRILQSKNNEIEYRLELVRHVAQTLKNGLNLLGIETVEKM